MSAPLERITPPKFLKNLYGKKTLVKLKWGAQYVGVLVSSDVFMNLQLTQCYEYFGQEMQGHIGEVLIRCNNVLTIRSAEEGEPGVPQTRPAGAVTD